MKIESVPHREHFSSFRKAKLAAECKDDTKHINGLGGRNVELVNAEAGGT